MAPQEPVPKLQKVKKPADKHEKTSIVKEEGRRMQEEEAPSEAKAKENKTWEELRD